MIFLKQRILCKTCNLCLILSLIFIFSLSKIASAQNFSKHFNFVLNFGISERPLEKRSELNTIENTFRGDLVDTLITIKLKLTRKVKQKVFDELMKMDFKNYPEKYNYNFSHAKNELVSSGTPCTSYKLIVSFGDSTQSVQWNDCIRTTTKDEKHEALMNLSKSIWQLIYTNKSYKKLPKPRSMYH